jgi:AI-2 transport protein TqsA
MHAPHPLSPGLRVLIGGACAVIIAIGLHQMAEVANPILLSTLVTLAILPLPVWMMRKGMSRGLAITCTLLFVLLGGLGVLSLLGMSIAQLVQTLPQYESGISGLLESGRTLLLRLGVDPAKLVPADALDPERMLAFAGSFFGGLAGMLSSMLLMVFITLFLLIEIVRIQNEMDRGLIDVSKPSARFIQSTAGVSKFISITGWLGLITAVLNYGLLLALGVDFAITWAFLSFLFNYIPTLGIILSIIPPLILALLKSGWQTMLMVIVGMLVINAIVERVLAPRMMKSGLDLSPTLLILSLIFWSWVLGGAGAILAVPLTIALKKIMEYYRELEKGSPDS